MCKRGLTTGKKCGFESSGKKGFWALVGVMGYFRREGGGGGDVFWGTSRGSLWAMHSARHFVTNGRGRSHS